MKNKFLQAVEDANIKEGRGAFAVGDTVDVHQLILEGDKTRTQVFQGTVIARKGGGVNETFTVRRLVQGEGVERIFLVHSPKIAKIDVKRSGVVRRAKLYYLRDRVGKATKLREKKKDEAAPLNPISKKPGARPGKAKRKAAAGS